MTPKDVPAQVVDASRSLTELRRGTVGFCVLALLAERPRYAVEVVRDLGSTEVLASGQGTIYPLLRRLQKEGLLETTWQESPVGPPRRYYRPTTQGESVLATFRHDWRSFRDGVDRLLGAGTR